MILLYFYFVSKLSYATREGGNWKSESGSEDVLLSGILSSSNCTSLHLTCRDLGKLVPN